MCNLCNADRDPFHIRVCKRRKNLILRMACQAVVFEQRLWEFTIGPPSPYRAYGVKSFSLRCAQSEGWCQGAVSRSECDDNYCRRQYIVNDARPSARHNEKPPLLRRLWKEKWCQGAELNCRPRAYESPALPLSYPDNFEKWDERSNLI